jgi:hypothetical protein
MLVPLSTEKLTCVLQSAPRTAQRTKSTAWLSRQTVRDLALTTGVAHTDKLSHNTLPNLQLASRQHASAIQHNMSTSNMASCPRT